MREPHMPVPAEDIWKNVARRFQENGISQIVSVHLTGSMLVFRHQLILAPIFAIIRAPSLWSSSLRWVQTTSFWLSTWEVPAATAMDASSPLGLMYWMYQHHAHSPQDPSWGRCHSGGWGLPAENLSPPSLSSQTPARGSPGHLHPDKVTSVVQMETTVLKFRMKVLIMWTAACWLPLVPWQ